MNVRTRIVIGVAIVVVAAAALFLFWNPDKNRNNNPALTTVTVAEVGDFFIYMPLYYAEDKGFFAKNGLDVHLIKSGGDDKSVAAVVSGSADFGVGDPTFAAIADQNGQDVRVIASVVNGVPFWGVTKNPQVPVIDNPSQLSGFRVATFPKPSTAYTLQAKMFTDGGLQPNIVQAQFGSLLPLLDNGQADIALELEPNVSIAAANGARVVYSMASKYPDFTITAVTVRASTLTHRGDVVRRFVTALDEAERAAHANPADAIAYAEKRYPDLPPGVAAAAMQRMLSSGVFPATAAVSQSGWAQAIQLRVASGDLTSASAGNGVVDNQFLSAH
jgi:NitT/TauT family transport system substrate-binding protein